MVSYGIVVATRKAHNDWTRTTLHDKLAGYRDFIENKWTNDIEEGNSSYSLSMLKSKAVEVDIDSPSDARDALSQARDYIAYETSLFDGYDSVLVVDTRTHSDAVGAAYQRSAGGTFGVGYVAGDGDKGTVGMEFGHTYGGAHGDRDPATFESTRLYHSLMGESGVEDCNDNLSLTAHGGWYSDCTQTAIRNYMDNNGL